MACAEVGQRNILKPRVHSIIAHYLSFVSYPLSSTSSSSSYADEALVSSSSAAVSRAVAGPGRAGPGRAGHLDEPGRGGRSSEHGSLTSRRPDHDFIYIVDRTTTLRRRGVRNGLAPPSVSKVIGQKTASHSPAAGTFIDNFISPSKKR